MSEAFDPYQEWLGIPSKQQPPHHYRLLGVNLFESDLTAIESAADRRISHVQTFQTGPHGPQAQELLKTLVAAKQYLLNPQKKAAYDQAIRARMSAKSPQAPAPQSQKPPVKPPANPEQPISAGPSVSAGRAVSAGPSLPSIPATPPTQTPAIPDVSTNKPPVRKRDAVTTTPQVAPAVVPSTPPPVPKPASGKNSQLLMALIAAAVCLTLVMVTLAGAWLLWGRDKGAGTEMAASPTADHSAAVAPGNGSSPAGESPFPTTTQTASTPLVSPFVEVPEDDLPPSTKPQTKGASQTARVPTDSAAGAVDLAALRGIRTGLTHWWGLHEEKGVRRDSLGTAHLTEQNPVGSQPGLQGTSARFSGNQLLRVPSDPTLQFFGSTTIALWVKLSSTSPNNGIRGSHSILGKWSSLPKRDYMICYNYLRPKPNRFEFIVWDDVARREKVLCSSVGAELDTWVFVVCQYEAERGRIGISSNNSDFDMMDVGVVGTTDSPLYIGADHGPPYNRMNGELTMLGMWNRLLSPQEITALYNKGSGVDVASLSLPK